MAMKNWLRTVRQRFLAQPLTQQKVSRACDEIRFDVRVLESRRLLNASPLLSEFIELSSAHGASVEVTDDGFHLDLDHQSDHGDLKLSIDIEASHSDTADTALDDVSGHARVSVLTPCAESDPPPVEVASVHFGSTGNRGLSITPNDSASCMVIYESHGRTAEQTESQLSGLDKSLAEHFHGNKRHIEFARSVDHFETKAALVHGHWAPDLGSCSAFCLGSTLTGDVSNNIQAAYGDSNGHLGNSAAFDSENSQSWVHEHEYSRIEHFDDWEVQPGRVQCSTSTGQSISELPLSYESLSGFGMGWIDRCSDLDISLVKEPVTSRVLDVIPPEVRDGLAQHYGTTAVAANHVFNAMSGDFPALVSTGDGFSGSDAVALTLHAHDQLQLICFDTLNQEVLLTPMT